MRRKEVETARAAESKMRRNPDMKTVKGSDYEEKEPEVKT
jgi:hypothetical protein